MPRKKYATVGEPDFHTLSDERVSQYLELIQQMIFSYGHYDLDKVEVLKKIWKDLADEDTDRKCQAALESIDKEDKPRASLTKAPKLRRSPAKRRV